MRMHSCQLPRVSRRAITIAVVWAMVAAVGAVGYGQTAGNTNVTNFSTQAVGGVSINTDGILANAQSDAMGRLSALRRESLEKIPAELNGQVKLRKVSLARLDATLAKCEAAKEPIPDAAKYLAGLQRIQYIFVYPEKKDIVLVGPAEGWRVDAKGNVVGVTTGRPVMLLDDLLVALRTAMEARNGGITCSIDPTKEGLARMNQELPSLTGTGNAQVVAGGVEKSLGMQQITVHGVPTTSNFARVLVAADYRMKRIAMNFDSSPVRGLPSYLQMVKPGARTVLSPRFWLEPKYDALLRDPARLAFELGGSGVKAMTEEDFIAGAGGVAHSGKASPMAQRWADLMTEKYAELAVADPIFGQLQNCMDLAITGALVAKERLTEKAGCSLPTLMQSSSLRPDAYNAPKQVESKASVLKKGRNWIISASGGVAIHSWMLADKAKPSDAVAPVRAKAVPTDDANWWWN